MQKIPVQRGTFIDKDYEPIGPEGIKKLAADIAAGNHPDLLCLSLRGAGIEDEGTKVVSAALAEGKAPKLSRVHLQANEMGPEGAAAFAALIAAKALPSLTWINLADNRIGAQGMTAVAEALADAPNLKILNVWNNNIGNDGANALGMRMLEGRCANLTKLHLQRNEIGAEGVETLARALERGSLSELVQLELTENRLGAGTMSVVDAVAMGNAPKLTSLSLDGAPAVQGVRFEQQVPADVLQGGWLEVARHLQQLRARSSEPSSSPLAEAEERAEEASEEEEDLDKLLEAHRLQNLAEALRREGFVAAEDLRLVREGDMDELAATLGLSFRDRLAFRALLDHTRRKRPRAASAAAGPAAR